MSAAAFAALKAELDVRASGYVVAAAGDGCSTGLAALDEALGGGFPRGTLATLEGPASSGRTAILAAILARTTQEGLAALVDDGSLYPPDLERAGVALERLLVAQTRGATPAARCADVLLRARSFAVVAMPSVSLRTQVWSRLCGLAQKAGSVLIAFGPPAGEPAYFASTRVACAIERVQWSSELPLWNGIAGYELSARVLKHRRTAPGRVARL